MGGLAAGLGGGLGLGLAFGLGLGLVFGLLIGLGIGLLIGLSYGGRACLQHLVLRLSLWYYDCLPRHYGDFPHSTEFSGGACHRSSEAS